MCTYAHMHLGEARCVCHSEGHVDQTSKRARKQGLARAGRTEK